MSNLLRVTLSHHTSYGPKEWSFLTRTFRRLKYPDLAEIYGPGADVLNDLYPGERVYGDEAVTTILAHAKLLGFSAKDLPCSCFTGLPVQPSLEGVLSDTYNGVSYHSIGIKITGILPVADVVLANALTIFSTRCSDGMWGVFMRREGTSLYLFWVGSSAVGCLVFAPKRNISNFTQNFFAIMAEVLASPAIATSAYLVTAMTEKAKNFSFIQGLSQSMSAERGQWLRTFLGLVNLKLGIRPPTIRFTETAEAEDA